MNSMIVEYLHFRFLNVYYWKLIRLKASLMKINNVINRHINLFLKA